MRKAKVRLTPDDLLRMLCVPDGAYVIGVQVQVDPPGVVVVVHSETFPDVPPDNEAHLVWEKYLHDDGTMHVVWPRQEPSDGPAVGEG